MNSNIKFNTNLKMSQGVDFNIYSEDLLTKFDYTRTTDIDYYKNIFEDDIIIDKSYILKYIKYFWEKIDEKYKNTDFFDITLVVNEILKQLPNKMNRFEFYTFVSDTIISKCSKHILYLKMASMMCIDKLHKSTSNNIKKVIEILYNNKDINNDQSPLVSNEYYNIILEHHELIQKKLDIKRDYLFDFFGLKTLERSYLLRIHENKKIKIIERPQHLIMRLAIGIHGNDLESAFETYDLISLRYFTHATPTLFNAGTNKPQLSSCFLIGMGDSIESIFNTISDMAFISKWAGGLGLHMSGIRSRGSIIRGTNGKSDGIVPLAIVLNWVARYINQGGKRNGSIACYLEPWHADIFEFCELRSNKGSETMRARDLFLALWIPDLFMKRLRDGGMWSLMCPNQCPRLNSTHGEEFEKLYTEYEKQGKYIKQVKAVDLWKHIMTSQIETGGPYCLYKDHANNKSNQQNLGTIRSSNLCAEIIEYSDDNEHAVCNLSSICLPKFIINQDTSPIFDYDKLQQVTRVCVRNLNKVIDINFYPTEKTKLSNYKHRPIGIGVQGLADVYNIMKMPFDSDEARDLNKRIFESIYFAAIDESKELAKKFGPYSTFKGSPFSKGQLQYHLWGLTENDLLMGYDWKKLIDEVKKYGTRNSLLTALMPTASTAQIMNNSETMEPYMSNIFIRSTLAGDFIVVNTNLMEDLLKLGLWNEDMRKKLIIYNGSIQNIKEIPDNIKEIYKTAFEMSLKNIIKQSADRGPFIDQSQSLNLFIDVPSFDVLSSAMYTAWDMGLKTGMYYCRSVPAVNPISFGIDIDDVKELTNNKSAIQMLIDNFSSKNNNKQEIEECLVCGS